VRKGVRLRPAFWFFGSLLLRMSIALAGFYFVPAVSGAVAALSRWIVIARLV